MNELKELKRKIERLESGMDLCRVLQSCIENLERQMERLRMNRLTPTGIDPKIDAKIASIHKNQQKLYSALRGLVDDFV